VSKPPIAFLTLLALSGCSTPDEGAPSSDRPAAKVETEEQRVYYALGVGFGQNLGELSAEQVAAIQQGLEDQALGREPVVAVAEMQPQIATMLQERAAARAAKARADGERFVAQAAQKEGVRQLESGIVIEMLEEGGGPRPKPEDRVRVHYSGAFVDGTQFDSSIGDEPASFAVGGVIPCWRDALQELNVGSKVKLTCPANTAYGDNGKPPTIPGGAVLVFDVELLEILEG
jgi:FKBP-type peptidyl-prolyl cis-trans isomerase FkpA